MHTYDIDQLYASAVDELLVSRSKSGAIGGANNIRQRGDGPERAVRRWITAVIGNQYRVTHGHVVRADGRKSQQVDVIVVRDVPIATLYPGDQDDAELVLRGHGQNPVFLAHTLNAEDAVRQKVSLGKGDAVVHLHARELARVTLHLPSLPEQRRIAAVLDAADTEVALHCDLNTHLRTQKRFLLEQLLTGKLRIPPETGLDADADPVPTPTTPPP